MATLSKPQAELLAQATKLAKLAAEQAAQSAPGTHIGASHGVLVQGPTYRTAEALEKRGLGTLRYQGSNPMRGWFVAKA